MSTVLSRLSVLPGLLLALSCMGATIDDAQRESVATAAPASAPCLRVRCVDSAALLDRSQAMSTPRVFVKGSRESSGERTAAEHTAGREQVEDYNCLLSVGFGGELRAHGYQGFKALGQTWSSKASDKGPR